MAIRLVKYLPQLLIGIGILTSVGCATVYQETAGRVWQDRSGVDQKIDFKIHSGILKRLSDKDKGLLLDLSGGVRRTVGPGQDGTGGLEWGAMDDMDPRGSV